MQSRLYELVFVILNTITAKRVVSNDGHDQLLFNNKTLLLLNNYLKEKTGLPEPPNVTAIPDDGDKLPKYSDCSAA